MTYFKTHLCLLALSLVLAFTANSANGQVRFQETGGGSEYVGFSAPASVTSNLLWVLPATDGSPNQCLATNGSGTLSWQSAGGGGLIGKLKYAGTGSCIWSSTSASWANHSAQASCPTATVTGSATAPGTKIPGVTFASLAAGDYEVTVSAQFYIDAASASCRWTISDGTTREGLAAGNMSGETGSNLTAQFSYGSTQSNITFQVQAIRTAGTGTCMVANDESGVLNFVIWVKKL